MKLIERDLTIPKASDSLTIIPVSDIHWGDESCSESHLRNTFEEIKGTPHCWWVGVGDYTDFCRATARRYLRSYTADATSLKPIERIVRDAQRELYQRYFKAVQSRCLGLVQGNHTWEYEDGTTTDQQLCGMMDAPYLADFCLMRINIKLASGHPLKTFLLTAHHGDWGGNYSTPGGDLNSIVAKGRLWDADISLFAHSHQRNDNIITPMSGTRRGEFRVIEVPHLVVRTGGYLRAYMESNERGRYTEKKQLPATQLGHVTIRTEFYQEYDADLYHARREAGRSKEPSGASGYKYRFKTIK